MSLDNVLNFFEQNKESFKQDLMSLAKIPSVSADGYDPEELVKCANKVKDLMIEAGLKNAEVIKYPNAHPYAYGEWCDKPDKPTLLLYAHHDVQPAGKVEKWITGNPWEPKEIDGRIYGRGIVDDKAGVMIHLAAIKSYLETHGELPLNIKFIVEGEEESGSKSLASFLHDYKEKIQADCIILTDTANLYEGLPSITYLLRGIVGVDVEVSSLKQQVHSGVWGGPLPDPAMALVQLLASLKNTDGSLNVEGIYNGVKVLSHEEKERLASLPFDQKQFEEDAGLLEGASLLNPDKITVYEQLWHQPALTITALESCTLKDSANQISESARARISLRIVPEQSPEEISKCLVNHLNKYKPEGVLLKTEIQKSANWWYTDYSGKAFESAVDALEKGYGKKPVFIGCGGTIPFVKPFADNLGGVPALLLGLEDPICHAHSENESLSISDYFKAIKSAIYIYDNLAKNL